MNEHSSAKRFLEWVGTGLRMASEIVVPKWGLTTDEIVLSKWLKDVGDRIAVDEPVAEVETDKVETEILSQVEGTIVDLLVAEGGTVEMGQPIARIEP